MLLIDFHVKDSLAGITSLLLSSLLSLAEVTGYLALGVTHGPRVGLLPGVLVVRFCVGAESPTSLGLTPKHLCSV